MVYIVAWPKQLRLVISKANFDVLGVSDHLSLRRLLVKNGVETLLAFHHLTGRFKADLTLQKLFLVVAGTHDVLLRGGMLVILGHLFSHVVVEIDGEDFFIQVN